MISKKLFPIPLQPIYDKLKDKYELNLTNTFSLENGIEDYREDFEILCGESSAGSFRLYHCGMYFIFDVDKPDGNCIHWHPFTVTDAINDVIDFMEGKLKC